MNIAIYGATSARIEEKYTDAVYDLAYKMAERGHSLVFGAGGTGVMGAAARGTVAGGGNTYGYIPKFFLEKSIELLYLDCTEINYTEDMRERKHGMEHKADGFIVGPGGIGTLEEFFEILTLKQLGRHQKPIVLFNSFGFYDGLVGYLNKSIEKDFISPLCNDLYFVTDDPIAALEYIENPPYLNYDVSELKK